MVLGRAVEREGGVGVGVGRDGRLENLASG